LHQHSVGFAGRRSARCATVAEIAVLAVAQVAVVCDCSFGGDFAVSVVGGALFALTDTPIEFITQIIIVISLIKVLI